MKKLFIITMLVFTMNITVFSAETPKQKKIKELFQESPWLNPSLP